MGRGVSEGNVSEADSYGNEKLLRKWTKSVFVFVFFNLMGTRIVQICIAKSVSAFRNKTVDPMLSPSGYPFKCHEEALYL